MKRTGPNTEPWGTPLVITLGADLTYCIVLLRVRRFYFNYFAVSTQVALEPHAFSVPFISSFEGMR